MNALIPEADIGPLRAAVVDAYPELANARFTPLTAGWDCLALDADGRLIFKFPRHAAAERALTMEAGLLGAIRPAVTMPVPDLTLHRGPPLFSRHVRIPGEHLVTAQYERLPDAARQRLAADMARFYAELHRLAAETMRAAGARPVEPFPPPEQILRDGLPALPAELHAYAKRTIAAWQDLPPDPHGTIYGFFDGHGWNMAFDHERQRLNGIYDFGDSGFGPLHREFIYSNWISADLTARIAAEYERLTGRLLDRRRIALLTGVHRLSERAGLASDPRHADMTLKAVVEWAALHPA